MYSLGCIIYELFTLNEYYLDNVREYGARRRARKLGPQDLDAMTEEEINEWYEFLGRRHDND